MGAMQRNKGANFERAVAKELSLRLGITFKRDLTQYQTADRGDLIADDPDWPFLIECKHCNRSDLPAWRRQAVTAARTDGLMPVVVYRLTGQPMRVNVPFSVLGEGWGSDLWADMDLDGFCFIAREIMAEPKAWVPNDYRSLRDRITGKDAE